jgi:pimeloyl-ACP methyl ester carboxylesterase
MRKLKEIIAQTKTLAADPSADITAMFWQLICHSPRMPLRLQQEQLLNEDEKFTLQVADIHFAKKDLSFNCFKWGNGNHKILLTHGWGSKAADLSDIIIPLKELNNVQVIAFDAPGNGSSEGELSNLLLFILAIKAVIKECGEPDVVIGHSLGAMANVMALQRTGVTPSLLISITPLIRLKENFEASMNNVGATQQAQDRFFEDFVKLFGQPAADFNMIDQYNFDASLNHWLAYDGDDRIAPYIYLDEFLALHPSIKIKSYDGAGHERILKSAQMIKDLLFEVRNALGI